MAIEPKDDREGGDALVEFGFDGDDWLRILREGRTNPLGTLGSYDLVAEVGRGGQGVVYRGRQRGTGREVALKRLLAGAFATDEARKRFEREVEAASTLRHAGVVTVYGLEMVEGQPVLAMEWIEGIPITRWAASDGGRSVEDILRAFLQVCDAVAHAHRNGVIHRDLKPSNILVDREDHPRVLDFGMAKISYRVGGEDAPLTAASAFAGTIAYASPEQVGSGAAAADTRSDVYSLGIILHELLSGRPVLASDATLEQLVDAIVRTDPPRPSQRNPRVPRELDHVVMAAIAKDRVRRYASVDELAADIRRFLGGEALQAHPPSRWYRARKLVATHRLASALTAGIVVISVAFLVTSVRQAARLKSERDAALRSGKREEAARRMAEAGREHADAAIAFLMQDMIGAADPAKGGRGLTVGEAVDKARAVVGSRFPDKPALEASVRRAIGEVYWKLARYPESVSELRRSVELRRSNPHERPVDLAGTLVSLSRTLVQQGKHEEARAYLAEAREVARAAGPEGEDTLSVVLDDLAVLESERGGFARAVELAREGLELTLRRRGADSPDVGAARQNLAVWLLCLDRVGEARAELAEALRVLEKNGQTEGVDSVLTNLGWAHVLLGNLDEGIRTLRRATALCEARYGDHPETACTLAVLARALMRADQLPEAEAAATRAVALHRAASQAPRHYLASAIGALARIRAKRGDLEVGAKLMAEAETMFRTLGNSDMAAKAATELAAMSRPADSRPASRENR
jgi:eukaryotic-like serine/threonine-protein kinase